MNMYSVCQALINLTPDPGTYTFLMEKEDRSGPSTNNNKDEDVVE